MARDPTRPKVLHDAKGPCSRLLAAGLALAGLAAIPRSRPIWCCPASAPTTWPIWSCASSSASCAPDGPVAEQTQLSLDGGRRAAAHRSRRWSGPAVARPGRRAGRRAGRPGRTQAAARGRAAVGRRAGRMERVGIAADHDYLVGLESEFAAAVQRRRRTPTTPSAREFNLGSPKQLQEVLFGKLGLPKTKRTKTGYTTDADALAGLSRRPSTRSCRHLLRHRDASPAAHHRRGTAQAVDDDGRIHTTFNQTSPRPGACRQHRSQPAEHPDPHRGGSAHPRGLRRRRGLRVPDHRRLQPDRAADHGPPVRGRRADRGLRVRRGLPRATAARVFGVAAEEVDGEHAAPRSRR